MRVKRAYIMLETVVAGAIVAIGLGTTISLIAGARFEASMAAKRAEASAWAMTVADSVMATSSTTGQPLTPVPNHIGLKSGYTIALDSGMAQSIPALTDPIHRIVVTVEFTTSQGPAQLVYERLRRSAP